MATHSCPQGHASTEADFCSECGLKIGDGSAGATPTLAVPTPAGSACPDCGTPPESADVVFCEVCGYNFRTGAHGQIAAAAAPPVVPGMWELEITVDPGLQKEDGPPAPALPPQTIRLQSGSNLIGRCSERRGIFPEVSLDSDDAVSHRHALIERQSNGGLTLRDIGSSNGTQLNGKELPPLTDHPLQDGDEIVVGRWTRIRVHAGQGG